MVGLESSPGLLSDSLICLFHSYNIQQITDTVKGLCAVWEVSLRVLTFGRVSDRLHAKITTPRYIYWTNTFHVVHITLPSQIHVVHIDFIWST